MDADRGQNQARADAVAKLQVDRVLHEFRTAFVGRSSPIHFFWGSFDLAVTRFSSRRAPLHPGEVPFLPDRVTSFGRSAGVNKLAGAELTKGHVGLPLLREALAWFEYRLVDEYPAGDHVLVL